MDRFVECNLSETLVGTEVAMPMPECVVHFRNEGTGPTIDQGDPETDRVILKPQETRLRQKQYLRIFKWKASILEQCAKPVRPKTPPANAAVVPILHRPEVEPVMR